jgi:hypothetical protein
MSERKIPERDFRKAIRGGLSGGLGALVTGGTFKVYDNGKGVVIYKGDKMIDVEEDGDVYSSLSSRKSPKNVPSDK